MDSNTELARFIPKPAPKDHPGDFVKKLPVNALNGLTVCLINMPLRETAMPNTPPEGPGLMAARLRMYGADVSIIDLNAYRVDRNNPEIENAPGGRHLTDQETERKIRGYFHRDGEPDVIGLSGMITTLRWQRRVAKICRRLAPEAFLISGGGLATEIKTGLFKPNWIPELDAVAHSEGDDVIIFSSYEVKLSQKKRDRMTTSPYYLGEIGGRHRFMYDGNRPLDLNSLPYAAWDLLEEDADGNNVLEWYIKTPVWGQSSIGRDPNNSSASPFEMVRSLTCVSTRGCPHACKYCFRKTQGERLYGVRSPEHLVAEIAGNVKKYNLDSYGCPDDNFAVRVDRCQALPAAFEKAGLKILLGTHTRIDECTLDRIVPLRKAGFVYIGPGLETASKKILISMGKGGHIVYKNGKERMTHWNGFEFPTCMMEGIQNCHDLGIHVNGTWIMGWMEETLPDLQTSVAFMKWQEEIYTKGKSPGTPEYARAYNSVNRRMFTATWYPGTEMGKNPKVQALLSEHFGLSFDALGEVVCDDAFLHYVEELDDATKMLVGTDGKPLNWSDMPDEIFMEARSYVDSGETGRILEM